MPTSPKVHCHPYFKLRRLTPHFQIGPQAPAPWNVPNLCAAYNWPTGLTGGGVIAIVELGGGWVQSDMDQYFKSINQPVPQITDVSVDGTQNSPNQSPGSNSDPDYEVALDIEVAAAAYYAATGKPATIRMYWSQDIASAVQKAANDGCDVCSISWGADEATWGTDGRRMRWNQPQLPPPTSAWSSLRASGDNDSSDGGSTPANVDAPSSCPHVVGCGGTYKTSTVETVWNDNPGQTNGEGTGGGYSTIFPVQSLPNRRASAARRLEVWQRPHGSRRLRRRRSQHRLQRRRPRVHHSRRRHKRCRAALCGTVRSLRQEARLRHAVALSESRRL